MFEQAYMHTVPSFTMPNPGSAAYTPRYNGQTYTNRNSNYQALYVIVAYTNPIPLSGSSLGFLPNHAYQKDPHFNTYGQPEADGIGYETPPQFPIRPQSIGMTLAQATAEPGTDPNNLTNQLATILRESFGIEHKG
jgi:hypothetical protein